MDDSPLDPDPKIAALLDFEPVVRRTRRHDGWTAARQRGFVASLARLGEVDRAAESVGRTASGAWKVRASGGAGGFADAWDLALDLFHGRNPLLSRRGGRARAPWSPPEAEREEDDEQPLSLADDELLRQVLDRYRKKLQQERECRLAGRIVEADFYVRQLTIIEIALDLALRPDALFELFRSGDLDTFHTIGTPRSVLIDRVRRDYWRERGEPDRMELPLLGDHDERGATGHRSSHHYDSARDGDYAEWKARRQALEALQAEAQRLWEEKAKADAEAWAERLKRAAGGGPADAGDARP